jgi:hypothetical protein
MFSDRAIHRACGLAVLAVQHLLHLCYKRIRRSDIRDLPAELLDDIAIPEATREMLRRKNELRQRHRNNQF